MSASRAIPGTYDIPQTPMVINLDGKKTVVQPNKTGYIHYLDAKTGKFIKATPFADKITWIKGYDNNGRPIDMVPLPKEGGDPVEVGRACWAG
jgi:glucose dehydrogenase